MLNLFPSGRKLLKMIFPGNVGMSRGGGVDWVSSHPPRGMKCRQKK